MTFRGVWDGDFLCAVYTYIQSRFYRSPEVILGISYGRGIDMWSFGCILAELYTGYPLFPGENEVEQLACIMEVLGVPPKRLVELASRKKLFFGLSISCVEFNFAYSVCVSSWFLRDASHLC